MTRPGSTKSGFKSLNAQQFAVVVIMIALGGLMLSFLGGRIRTELSTLAAAATDNRQWEVAQIDVEVLVLLNSIKSFQLNQTGGQITLDEIRKRFDIFYSRVEGNRTRELKHPESSVRETAQKLTAVLGLLDSFIPLIDGPDNKLISGLDDLRKSVEDLRLQVRTATLDYVRLFAQQSDTERRDLAELIERTSTVGLVLLLALSLSTIVLIRLMQTAAGRAKVIEEINERFENTIFASLDAILVTDSRGIVLDLNPAAERMFGYSRSALLGAQLSEQIVPPRLRKAHAHAFDRFVNRSNAAASPHGRLVTTAQRADGEEFPAEVSFGAASHDDDRIVIGFVRDISDRIRAEMELISARDEALAAARARSSLLAFMSHEMRTPLNGVMAILDLLRTTKLDPVQRGYVETATRSGDILLHLINDALDLTRIQADVLSLEEEAFDLAAVIEETTDINRPVAAANGDTIAVELDEAQTFVHGDRKRLRQILMNLIGNAVKFTRNGTITVHLSTAATSPTTVEVRLNVADTGVGIAESELERIFDEFVSLKPTDTWISRGTGLGLSISRKIAALMGGKLTVESRLGEGSSFTLVLPMGIATPEPAALTDAGAPNSATSAVSIARGLNVLLVEDNPTNRFVAREMLLGFGCLVDEAEDGLEGVEKAEAKRYDVILMDVAMPQLDGIAATRAIRNSAQARSRNTPIIGLTAHVMQADREALLAAGMQECLFKPLRLRDLAKMLGELPPAAGVATCDDAPTAGGVDATIAAHQADHGAADEEIDESDTAMIDHEALIELSELLGSDMFALRLKSYLGELATLEATLDAVADVGPGELGSWAHRFAGSAAIFGAERLRRALNAVEVACHSGDAAAIAAARAEIGPSRKATIAAFEALRR